MMCVVENAKAVIAAYTEYCLAMQTFETSNQGVGDQIMEDADIWTVMEARAHVDERDDHKIALVNNGVMQRANDARTAARRAENEKHARFNEIAAVVREVLAEVQKP